MKRPALQNGFLGPKSFRDFRETGPWPGRMTTLGKSHTHSQFCRIFALCLRDTRSQAVCCQMWCGVFVDLRRFVVTKDRHPEIGIRYLLDCSMLRSMALSVHTIVFCCSQNCENDPLCRRLRLQDIISSSYQRFTKYPLLLEGIQTNTPSKFHELNFWHQKIHRVHRVHREYICPSWIYIYIYI